MTVGIEDSGSGRVTALVSRVLAQNAGALVLDGTNTYVIRHPDSPRAVVVDPGPDDDEHLGAIAAHGDVELILLTHHHPDHSDGAAQLSRMTGAPVRAVDPGFCVDGDVLSDDEELLAGGTRIRVVGTPGHTADSVSFHLADDRPIGDGHGDAGARAGSMLTGDTILGRGTSVIALPDGSVGPYLTSLDRLREFGSAMLLPGHGPVLGDLAAVAAQQYQVRTEMLRVVEDVVARFAASTPPREVTVRAVSDIVYSTLPRHLRFAAESTVSAQLAYLGVSVRAATLTLDDAPAPASPSTAEGLAPVEPVTAASSLGAWLDHPTGGPLVRSLLTQVGVGEGVFAPLARMPLEKLMVMSKGLLTQELVDDLVRRAAHP